MSCSMTRHSDAGEARNRGPLVSSSQCLNTKCGQSKRFGTGPGRVRVQTFLPNTQLPPIGMLPPQIKSTLGRKERGGTKLIGMVDCYPGIVTPVTFISQ